MRNPHPSEALLTLVTAYREAVQNAAIHGNRESPGASIHINCVLTPTEACITVCDEGPGFDYQRLIGDRDPIEAARERQEQGLHGGLGILLMARCVDEIHYNERGNAVTLRKIFKKQ